MIHRKKETGPRETKLESPTEAKRERERKSKLKKKIPLHTSAHYCENKQTSLFNYISTLNILVYDKEVKKKKKRDEGGTSNF